MNVEPHNKARFMIITNNFFANVLAQFSVHQKRTPNYIQVLEGTWFLKSQSEGIAC